MANNKQSPVTVIILIAVIVIAGFFIVRAIPSRPPAVPMPDYFVCVTEGCPFRISMREMEATGECLGCGGMLIPEGMELSPEMMPPLE